MDDETAAWIAVIIAVSIPFILVLSMTACVAYSRTRQWKKEKARRENTKDIDVEMDPLVEQDDEEDLDLDSDEEAEKAENQPDWDLTPRQKFRKEFKKAIKGETMKQDALKKQREERVKNAKALAKEIARLERRRIRRKGGISGTSAGAVSKNNESSLPSYKNAIAGDHKA